MSVFPRWFDDFSTDPLADPAYQFNGSHSYDGVADTLIQDGAAGQSVTLLNSNNSYGIVEVDALWVDQTYTFTSTGKAYIRAFGYHFVIFRDTSRIYSESDLGWFNSGGSGLTTGSFFLGPFLRNSRAKIKMISTPNGVDFYVNDVFLVTLPSAVTSEDVRIGGGATEGQRNIIYSLSVKSDSSLPKESTVIQPAPAGALPTAAGPLIVTVPESRLYLDLGSYSTMNDVDNVVYDPGGGAVAMAEDIGIPDRAGATTGDFYLEIPNRGVASDKRLVLKDQFVTDNSVVVTDDVDFDVLPSPATQNALIKEEDDIHVIVQKSDQASSVEYYSIALANDFANLPTILGTRPNNNLIMENSTNFTLHNLNADGNDAFIVSGHTPLSLFNDSFNVAAHTLYGAGFSHPIIYDIDMGKVRNITGLIAVTRELADNTQATTCDVYSNTVPFVGAGLGQGTLEIDDHNIYRFVTSSTPLLANIVAHELPSMDITTRYLRLVINSDNVVGGPTATVKAFKQLYLYGTDPIQIDSENDNAQFKHEPAAGGGFVAYPAGGVTQGDGKVEITLPTEMEVESGSPNDFFRFSFKPDITD